MVASGRVRARVRLTRVLLTLQRLWEAGTVVVMMTAGFGMWRMRRVVVMMVVMVVVVVVMVVMMVMPRDGMSSGDRMMVWRLGMWLSLERLSLERMKGGIWRTGRMKGGIWRTEMLKDGMSTGMMMMMMMIPRRRWRLHRCRRQHRRQHRHQLHG